MLLSKNPTGRIATGVFLCLSTASALAQVEPFSSHNHNPLKYIHGQPLPVAATLPSAKTVNWSLGLSISNTLNLESTPLESLVYDYEAYNVDFSLSYGLAADWALKLDVAAIHRGGGLFDSAIDNWHQALGLPRANRDQVANDQLQITYINNGNTEANLVSDTQGPGDIQLGIGYQLSHTDNHVASAWLIAELATGDQQKLTGNDELDVALLLAGDYRIDNDWLSYNNLGVLFPGSDRLVNAIVEPHIWFGHSGLQWRWNKTIAFKTQVNAHSRYYQNSQIRMLGSAYSLVLGATFYFDNCNQLDIALEEDIKVDASADISVLLNWRNTQC